MTNVIHDVHIDWPSPLSPSGVDKCKSKNTNTTSANANARDDDSDGAFAAGTDDKHWDGTKKHTLNGGFPLGTTNWAAAALYAAQPTAFKVASYDSTHSFPKHYYRPTRPQTTTMNTPNTANTSTTTTAATQSVPYREAITGVFEANGITKSARQQAQFYLDEATMMSMGLAAVDDDDDDDDNDDDGDNDDETGNAVVSVAPGEGSEGDAVIKEAKTHLQRPKTLAERILAQQARTADDPDTTNAFLVHGLLSPAECRCVRRAAEPLLASLEAQYAQKHRKASRAMFRCPALTRRLYERLLPHLCAETDYRGRIPLCFGQDGVWVPFGLNECLKVFAYEPGGEFVPHRDGPWVPREDQCSMYTVVVYLNEAMRGGETMLLGTAPLCAPQGSRMMTFGNNAGMQIPPITGSALVFNHDCWHAGLPVLEGRKLILRTELIFQRVQSFYVDRHAFCSDAEYQRTRALYDASQQALKEGRREAFFEQYQEVVALQQAASQRAWGRRATTGGAAVFEQIGPDATALVVEFLGIGVAASKRPEAFSGNSKNAALGSSVGATTAVGCSFPALLATNKRTCAAILTCPLWERLLRERHCASLYAGAATVVTNPHEGKDHVDDADGDAALAGQPEVGVPAAACFAAALTAGIRQWTRKLATDPFVTTSNNKNSSPSFPPSQDHFSRFRQQERLRKTFSPACLVLRPAAGSVLVTHPSTAATPDILKYIGSGHGDLGQRLARLIMTSTVDGMIDNTARIKTTEITRSASKDSDVSDETSSSDDDHDGSSTTTSTQRPHHYGGYDSYLLPAYFGDWCYAYPFHMNQPDAERFCLYADYTTTPSIIRESVRPIMKAANATSNTTTTTTATATASATSSASSGHRGGGGGLLQVDWSVLSVPIEGWVEATAAPLLLCPPPEVWVTNDDDQQQEGGEGDGEEEVNAALLQHIAEAQEGIFGLLRAPAMAILHPATCALLGHLSSTGSTSTSCCTESSSTTPSALRLISGVGIPLEENITSVQKQSKKKPVSKKKKNKKKKVPDALVVATPEEIAVPHLVPLHHHHHHHHHHQPSNRDNNGSSTTTSATATSKDDVGAVQVCVWGVVFVSRSYPRDGCGGSSRVTAFNIFYDNNNHIITNNTGSSRSSGSSSAGLAVTPRVIFHRAGLVSDDLTQSAVLEACNACCHGGGSRSRSRGASAAAAVPVGVARPSTLAPIPSAAVTSGIIVVMEEEDYRKPIREFREALRKRETAAATPPPPSASAFAASLRDGLRQWSDSCSTTAATAARNNMCTNPPPPPTPPPPPPPPLFFYADNVMMLQSVPQSQSQSLPGDPSAPSVVGGAVSVGASPSPAPLATATATTATTTSTTTATAFGSACLMARGAALALHCCDFREAAVFRF